MYLIFISFLHYFLNNGEITCDFQKKNLHKNFVFQRVNKNSEYGFIHYILMFTKGMQKCQESFLNPICQVDLVYPVPNS